MAEAVRAGSEVYSALRKRLARDGHSTGLGDEGGFAPSLAEPEEVLDVIVDAIVDAGYEAGSSGVAIALDPAASEFHGEDGLYSVNGQRLSSAELIQRYAAMVDKYPIWSIEDGLGEADHDGWQELTRALGARVQLVATTTSARTRTSSRARSPMGSPTPR
jgi:enolase